MRADNDNQAETIRVEDPEALSHEQVERLEAEAAKLAEQLRHTRDKTAAGKIKERLGIIQSMLPARSRHVAASGAATPVVIEDSATIAAEAFTNAVRDILITDRSEQAYFDSFDASDEKKYDVITDGGLGKKEKISGNEMRRHYANVVFHRSPKAKQEAVLKEIESRIGHAEDAIKELKSFSNRMDRLFESLRVLESRGAAEIVARHGGNAARAAGEVRTLHAVFENARHDVAAAADADTKNAPFAEMMLRDSMGSVIAALDPESNARHAAFDDVTLPSGGFVPRGVMTGGHAAHFLVA